MIIGYEWEIENQNSGKASERNRGWQSVNLIKFRPFYLKAFKNDGALCAEFNMSLIHLVANECTNLYVNKLQNVHALYIVHEC